MGMIDIGKLDRGGVNKDMPPYRLAPNTFNEVMNVDFEQDCIVPAVKEIGAFYGMTGNPVYLEEVEGPNGVFNFIYFLTNQAYVWSGGTFHEITNPIGMGASTEVDRWNGGFFHGWWIWTNGNGIPQKWNPQTPLSSMLDLDNWPSDISIRFIRPYLNFLVGFSYTSTTAGFSKQIVYWSDQVDPGVLPSWDLNDPTKKAGIYSLTADSDPIEGAAELRGEMFIYKRSSVWVMRYIGGTFVMNFAPRFSERGLLNSRCIVALEGIHFCIDRAGFYFHNGITITPVGSAEVWTYFSDFLSEENLFSIFIEYEEAKSRIWIFYSTENATFADRVLIYDIKNQTWTFRSVQQASCAVRGSMKNLGSSLPWDHFQDVWQTDILAWESDSSVWSTFTSWDNVSQVKTWNDETTGGVQRSIHYASAIDPANNVFDALTGLTTSGSVQWPGSTQYPPIWYVGRSGARVQGTITRIGFCVLEQDASGAFFVDQTVYKHLTEFYMELANGPIEVRLGTHPNTQAPVTWGDWMTFDPLVDLKLDVQFTDKYLAFELRGIEGSPVKWSLSGLSLNVNNAGRY